MKLIKSLQNFSKAINLLIFAQQCKPDYFSAIYHG